jgi:hypothetical protein
VLLGGPALGRVRRHRFYPWVMSTVEALLAGPRGRRLCWTVLWLGLARAARQSAAWPRAWEAVTSGDLAGHLDEFAAGVALADPAALAGDRATVFEALGWTVDTAQYWSEPDAEDRALAHEAVSEALRPIAAALLAAPGSRWWASPVDLARQRYAQFRDDHPFDEPMLSGAAGRVAAWRADTVRREESLRATGAEPLGAWSGEWWSDPAMSGLPVTTRALPGLGAVRLALVEDGLGWKSARCWPLLPRSGARIYEVDGPAAWASLVARYPLDVSMSRRHDWWRATGWTGRWLIPDFQAVAGDFDAVHVTVLGYLTTAGVAVPVGSDDPGDGARTVLAGWEPDATWWLTDCLASAGPPEDWSADDDAAVGWQPAG